MFSATTSQTFAIENRGFPPPPKLAPELLAAWSAVRAAQVAVLAAASQNGSITGDVDAAARKALRDFDGDNEGGELAKHGWDVWFTHRVGHGASNASRFSGW
jgi:Xaa-Pro aminopeptidase